MSAKENKDIVRRAIDELWNKGSLGPLDQFWSPGYAHHDPVAPQASDLAGYREWLSAAAFANFVDQGVAIEDLLADGDQVAVRYTWRGTTEAGKQLTSTGIDIYRVIDGVIVEAWIGRDRFSLGQQIGELPAGKRSEFPWGWPE